MTSTKDLMKELALTFEAAKRDDGTIYYKLKKSPPDWLPENFMRDVHESVDGPSPRLPNDWIYTQTAYAAVTLADYDDPHDDDIAHEVADGLVEVYTASLYEWAADHGNNRALIDEAEEELGKAEDHEKAIMLGQYLALERIVRHLQDVVKTATEGEEKSR